MEILSHGGDGVKVNRGVHVSKMCEVMQELMWQHIIKTHVILKVMPHVIQIQAFHCIK